MDEDLAPFYNKHKRLFSLETVNGEIFELGVPTVGLQKSLLRKL